MLIGVGCSPWPTTWIQAVMNKPTFGAGFIATALWLHNEACPPVTVTQTWDEDPSEPGQARPKVK